MTFNTGNNVPSTDPRDLYDNAENLDKLVNGADPFYADRKGKLRESWAGMENSFTNAQEGRETAFTLSQADKESRFQAFLVSSGYVSKGDYAANVVLAERNEYVAVNAATTGTTAGLYRPGPGATLPLTLTGTWATDAASLVLLGDDVLRQELAQRGGQDLVGGSYRTVETVDRLRGVSGRYDGDQIFLLGHTQAGIGAGPFRWLAGSSAYDDGGTVIGDEGSPGRWVRQFSGPVFAEFFGALPGVQNDSTIAFRAAAAFAGRGGEWRWEGVHRITDTIRIPRQQTFGSGGQSYNAVFGNLTNWAGINNPSQNLSSAIFFDSDVDGAAAFECEEGAIPQNFTLYGRGFNSTVNGQNVSKAQAESAYVKTTAIRYNKFIKPSRITVSMFHTVFDSASFDSEQGNYYTSMSGVEAVRCFRFHNFSSTGAYNTKFYDCKATQVAQLINASVRLSDFLWVGGSIEGWNTASVISNGGELRFIGAYFETFHSAVVPAWIAVNGGICWLSFISCKVYLNNTQRLVYFSPGVSTGGVYSSNNRFNIGPSNLAANHIVYSCNASQLISTIDDEIYNESAATASIKALGETLVELNRNGIVNFGSSNGFRIKILSASPSSPESGVIYMANGGSWNPLNKTGGYAYPVIWRGAWEQL